MILDFIPDKIKISNKYLEAIFCLFIIISLLSCEDILEKPIDPYATTETEQALSDYIIGAYSCLAKGMSMYNLLSVKSDDINLQMHSKRIELYEYPTLPTTDEHFPKTEFHFFDIYDNFSEGIYEYAFTSTLYTDISLDFYRTMFRSILMCNKIISDLSISEKSEKWAEYLGEAYFLRAYLYFKMARVFGRLPLVIDLDVDYELPLAEFTDIYNQIEKDLIEAILYLPDNRYSSRKKTQTPHKGTAKVLLSEVYLTMGGYPVNDNSKYAKAAETAREVIENAEYYGFGLVDDFANLWQWQHYNNEESIWSIYYQGETFTHKAVKNLLTDNQYKEKITTEEYYFSKFPNNYRKEISFWHYQFEGSYEPDNILPGTDKRATFLFKDVQVIKFNEITLTTFMFNRFLRNVLGKKQTVNFSCYSDNLIKTLYPPLSIIDDRPEYYILNELHINSKYNADNEERDSIYNYLRTVNENPESDAGYTQFFHIFRFAHTLLTYAEAIARSGTPDILAYEAVNMIRRRANKLPVNTPSVYDLPAGLSADAFADSVVAERGWEFCHEFEGRWNDIIRLQLYPQIEANRYHHHFPLDRLNLVYKGQTYFIPIPQEDVWLNPNLGK